MKSRLLSLFLIVTLLVAGGVSVASAQDCRQEVTIWHYWGDTGTNAETVQNFKELWEESQGDCSLNIRSIPTADFKRELSTAILAGNTPDIAVIDNPDFAMFAAQGVLAELDERVAAWEEADAYYDGPWASTMWDGHNYGVPVGSNTLALFINNTLAEEAGLDVSNPPQTWDELTEWAAALTNPDNNPYGLTVLGERNETATFMWLPFAQQTGEDINSQDSEGGRAALQLYVDLVETGYMSPEIVNYGFGDIPGQFMAGNAAMMINGPWVINSLEAEAPDLAFTVFGVRNARDGEIEIGHFGFEAVDHPGAVDHHGGVSGHELTGDVTETIVHDLRRHIPILNQIDVQLQRGATAFAVQTVDVFTGLLCKR